MRCPECNAEIPDDARFCTACGCRIEHDQASAIPVPADEPAEGAEAEDSEAIAAFVAKIEKKEAPAAADTEPRVIDGVTVRVPKLADGASPTAPKTDTGSAPYAPKDAGGSYASPQPKSVDDTVLFTPAGPLPGRDDAPQAGGYAPVSAPAAPAAARTGAARIVIPVVAVLVVLGGVGIAAALTGGFGMFNAAQDSAQVTVVDEASSSQVPEEEAAPDPEPAGPTVRSTVNDYTWDELSQISALIAAAATDEEGKAIAQDYHLCASDGTLDGTQTKTVKMSNGVTADVQVAGFRHDDRADGSGKAGITFIFADAVATGTYNSSWTNAGGWEDSEMRSYLNSEIQARLPDDLQHVIVPVNKLTNNTGATTSAGSVTATSDMLWLPSYNEIIGDIDESLEGNLRVYNAEGDEYQLYVDTNVLWSAENPILVKGLGTGGSPISWWQRSPYPDNDQYVMDTGADGIPFYAHVPTKDYGIVPGFCI